MIKRSILTLAAFMAIFNVACDEVPVGQTPIDAIAPNTVSEVNWIGIPGGAKINYILPGDEDLLYVKAIYNLNDGSEAEVRASAYTSELTILGLGDTDLHTVKLFAVDRSENHSAPVEIQIQPELPPVFAVFNTLKVTEDWGGIAVKLDNPSEANLAITIMQEVNNEYVVYETLYRSSKEIKQSLRGFKSKTTNFAVFVRDRWNNFSDTLYVTLKPLYEVKIPYNMLQGVETLSEPDGWGWTLDNLWNNTNGEPGYHTVNGETWPHSFTVRFTTKCKLSRFKVYQRVSMAQWIFNHGNIKIFDVYGSNASLEELMANNIDWEESGLWTLIDNYESYKPSGLPIGQYSNDDLTIARDGEDFVIPNGTPEYQFLRFKIRETWSGNTQLHVMELPFYGLPEGVEQPDEEEE